MSYRYITPDHRIAANDDGWSGLATAVPDREVIADYVAPPVVKRASTSLEELLIAKGVLLRTDIDTIR